MEFDLETFLTAWYVITDELYQTSVLPKLPNSGGPDPNCATRKCPDWVLSGRPCRHSLVP